MDDGDGRSDLGDGVPETGGADPAPATGDGDGGGLPIWTPPEGLPPWSPPAAATPPPATAAEPPPPTALPAPPAPSWVSPPPPVAPPASAPPVVPPTVPGSPTDPATWTMPAGPPPDPATWTTPGAPPTGPPLPFGPSGTPGPGTAPAANDPAGTNPAGPLPVGWAPPGAAAGAPGGSPAPSAAGGRPPLPPPPGGWAAPLPPYAAGPTPSSPGVVKGRSRAALAILSVTAVLAASTFAAFALTRPDGAGSPEEAVEGLFAALEQEDAIGVMESLPPGEREVIIEPMVATVGELQRLGLLDSFELEDVPGADIEVEGLTLQSTNLAPGVAKVRVTGGTITGTVIPDEVPIGPKTRELAEKTGEEIEIEPESGTESLADADLELVAIEEDGGWHVSLFYTIAEAIRGDEHPLPQFGAGVIAPVGGETPEDAVRGLFDAALALDLGRVVGHLPPDEMRVLYDYVPLFLDEVDEAADDARDAGYEADLARLDLSSEGSGDTRRVTVTSLDLTVGADDAGVHYAWDGSCTVVEMTAPSYGDLFAGLDDDLGIDEDWEPTRTTTMKVEACSDGRITAWEDGEEVDVDEELGDVSELPFGNQSTFGQAITVVEHDGRWYVSPVRTVFDSMVTALRDLDEVDIDTAIESWGMWLGTTGSSRFEPVEGVVPGPSGTIPGPEPDDPYLICAEVFDDLLSDPDNADIEAAQEAFDQCLLDHGETPFETPNFGGDPRLSGGHVLVPGDDTITGYTFDGAEAFDGPTCVYGTWVGTDVLESETVAVAECESNVASDYELVAVDGQTGSQLWKRPAYEDEDSWYLSGPAVVLEVGDDTLTAIDIQTGADRWTESGIEALGISSDDRHVYVGDGERVTAYDVTTGEERWTVESAAPTLSAIPDGVVLSTDDGAVHLLDRASGATRWTTAVTVSIEDAYVVGSTGEVVLMAGYDDTDVVVAFDLATGAELWDRDDLDVFVGLGAAGTSVVAVDGYSPDAFVLDHRTGQVRPDVTIPGEVWALDVSGNTVVTTGYGEADEFTITILP